MLQKISKFLLKVIIWIFIIIFWFSYSTEKVGRQDIYIKYNIINEKISNSPKKSSKKLPKKNETKNDTKTQKEKENIKKILKEIFLEAISKRHYSADIKRDKNLFKRICKNYNQICSFTYFHKNQNIKSKIKYQSIIIYTIKEIDKILTTQKKLKSNIKHIIIDNKWKDRRWYAGHYTITLKTSKIKNYKEFYEVLTHELWHIIDLWLLEGYWNTKDKDFTEFGETRFFENDPSINFYKISRKNEQTRLKDSSFKDFVSGYALSNPFEDFAESINFYLNHYLVFQQMAKTNYSLKKKFEIMKNLFWRKYLSKWNKKNLKKTIEKAKRRPWDTTKTY